MTSFLTTATDLHQAATWAARVIPARPVTPVLAGLILDAHNDQLTVSAYDYDTAATTHIAATVTTPGRTLVSGRLFADIAAAIAKALKRDTSVQVEVAGSAVQVRAGRSEWSLPTLPLHEYPQLPELGDPVGQVDATELRRAVARVAPAAGRDDTLPMLTGIKLDADGDQLTVTATDRFRIATTTVAWVGGQPLDVLAPAPLLEAATRAARDGGQVAVHSGPGGLGFATDTHRVTGRLLDAQYVRWQQLMLADANHYAVVDAAALSAAAEQALVLGEQHLLLDFRADLVEVSAAGEERRARAEAPVHELVGDPIAVGLNPAYLRDALGALGDSRTRIHLGATPVRPLLFTPDSDADSFRSVLMPVRLDVNARSAA